MKKYIFLGLLLFTGCGHNKLMKMYGYFYIQPNYGTYVVMLSTSDGYDSDGDVTVTKNLSFEEATNVCNNLNKDLSQNINVGLKYKDK